MTNITVFGASKAVPDDALYEQSLHLGHLIGGEGWSVLTGGYIGTMEAVSRGTAEVGGHVIGVTCDEIESWRSIGPNQWVTEERRYPTTIQRLLALIDGCDAAIALPGGIGTLAEVAVLWSQLQIGAISPRPFLVIGPGWKSTLEAFISSHDALIPTEDRSWIRPVENVDAAFSMLKSYFME